MLLLSLLLPLFILLLTSLFLLLSLPLQQTSQLLYLVIAKAIEVFSIVWSACCCFHPFVVCVSTFSDVPAVVDVDGKLEEMGGKV